MMRKPSIYLSGKLNSRMQEDLRKVIRSHGATLASYPADVFSSIAISIYSCKGNSYYRTKAK